jgi:hypothetical protein
VKEGGREFRKRTQKEDSVRVRTGDFSERRNLGLEEGQKIQQRWKGYREIRKRRETELSGGVMKRSSESEEIVSTVEKQEGVRGVQRAKR